MMFLFSHKIINDTKKRDAKEKHSNGRCFKSKFYETKKCKHFVFFLNRLRSHTLACIFSEVNNYFSCATTRIKELSNGT